MDAFNYDLCHPVNMRAHIIGKYQFFYFISLWEMIDLDLALEKESRRREKAWQTMHDCYHKSGLFTPDASDREL